LKNNTDTLSLLLAISMAVLVMIYVGYRAYQVGFTHDESYTYTRYTDDSYGSIINYSAKPLLPNNHIANTLWVKFAKQNISTHPFALRWLNVMGFLFFLLISIRWLYALPYRGLLVGCFLCLVLNPYVLDYFMLARGYGIGMCFMWASCNYLMRFLRQPSRNLALKMWVLAALSVESNFSFLNFYLALLAVYGLVILNSYWQQHLTKHQVILYLQDAAISTIALIALIYEPIRKIVKAKQLFGGTTGFWHDTVNSLIERSLYLQTYSSVATNIVLYVIMVLFLIIVASAILQYKHKQYSLQQSPLAVTVLLLWVSAFSTIAQHYLRNTEFLSERTGIFYILLFVLTFIYWIQYLRNIKWQRTVAAAVVYSWALLAIIHAANCFNTNYVLDWRYDSDTPQMLTNLKLAAAKDVKPIAIGGNWIFEPTINFYQQTGHLDWLQPINQPELNTNKFFPYYYILQSDRTEPRFIPADTILHTYNSSNTILAK
jgi:hypothetical protein